MKILVSGMGKSYLCDMIKNIDLPVIINDPQDKFNINKFAACLELIGSQNKEKGVK